MEVVAPAPYQDLGKRPEPVGETPTPLALLINVASRTRKEVWGRDGPDLCTLPEETTEGRIWATVPIGKVSLKLPGRAETECGDEIRQRLEGEVVHMQTVKIIKIFQSLSALISKGVRYLDIKQTVLLKAADESGDRVELN